MVATPQVLSQRKRLETLGNFAKFFVDLWDHVVFAAKAVFFMPAALKYWREILALVSDLAFGPSAIIVGGGMLFVVVSISFFTGTEVGLEGFTGLHQIGAQAFTGVISSLANTREITPLVGGVALAAQVGAGYTAQIGAMKISEEIDALEVMGVRPVTYVVSTRLWAALIAMVPLYLAALFASFFASQIIVTTFFGLPSGTYHHYFQLFLPPIDVAYSLLKAMVFAFLVVLIHCKYGYDVEGGPADVGVAAGRAIRLSLVMVVLTNLFLSVVLFGTGGTEAKLVG